MQTRRPALAALILCATTTPAHAALPEPVRAMIDAAIATGDVDKVATVIDLAIQTNPDDKAEIELIRDRFADAQKQKAEALAAREEEELRSAGLLDNWSGKGEIGAARATGNSSETGVTLGLKLAREGIDWTHKIAARADYQRSNGVTTREQFLFGYEPNYRLSRRLFAYGLAQFERDRFQGFSRRISVSGGLGYKVIDRDAMHLSVKAGPAWRRTSLIPAGSTSSIAGLAALDFDWRFSENLKFTQDAGAYLQSGNSTFNSLTGLEAKFSDNLAARLSYEVEHDTSPPIGAVKTDTLSRFTLIYDF